MNIPTIAEDLVQRFRPVYRLHSEEMWYPCHPEDQLRCADLISAADGTVVIPALGNGPGSAADQLLATPAGVQQLAARGVTLDDRTIAALRWQATASERYAAYAPTDQFILQRADAGYMPPYGWLDDYEPADATWFHRGAPNNPCYWLGGDATRYAGAVLRPPPGLARGAWQSPSTSAWVQAHTVACKQYVDIIYNCFLAWNGSISLLAGQGEHPNDVETFIVRLMADDLDNPVRYFFQQHGGFSWYDPSHVEKTGERVTVYLARQSHECYPHPGRYTRLFGFADDLCDAHGVGWDAPAVYLDRPAGIDQYGIDTQQLRAGALPGGDPNTVLLVPLAAPGPLWQYVRFRFAARRPAGVPVSSEAFLHQPFPLSTTKWWPGEGPAGSRPPLSTIAAEPGAPGMAMSFFSYAAPYLGADPLPGACTAALANTASRPEPVDGVTYVATASDTITGAAIGGATAAQAPKASFVNWRGGIGRYLLAGVNTQLEDWVKLLPDPLDLDTVTVGPVTIDDLHLHGLHGLQVAPAAALSPDTIQAFANMAQLRFSGTLSIAGGAQDIALSATVHAVTLHAVVQLVTAVALSAADASQWYVPYVGPLPYSYATAPYGTTAAINSACATTLVLDYDAIDVDIGNSTLDRVIDLVLQALRTIIEQQAGDAMKGAVNALLTRAFDGSLRVG